MPNVDDLVERLKAVLVTAQQTGLSLPGEPAWSIEQGEIQGAKNWLAHYENYLPTLLESLSLKDKRIADLEAGLSAAIGYMMNARIDLETGATKKTAITTIQGGIDRARALLSNQEQIAENVNCSAAMKELCEAAEPFAEVAEKDIGSDEHDDDRFVQPTKYNHAPRLAVGHFRRLRSALDNARVRT